MRHVDSLAAAGTCRLVTNARDDRQPEPGCRSSFAEVQEFYERYPYPRPVDNLDDYRARWQDRSRRRADFHLFWPATEFEVGAPHPRRRLRNVAGGQARAALAERRRHGHRLQRDERALHRGPEAQARSRQPRGAAAPDRARRRARERRSIKSCARASCIISRIPSRRFARCATCSSRTARCTSWCTRLTAGPASTCSRSSAGWPACPPRTTEYAR